jgi:hypothetical protein
MKTKRNLLAAAAALIASIVLVWFATSIHGGEKTYEIQPHVGLPYGYTPTVDAHRLIDLIEHLIDQNQQITQKQLSKVDKNLKGLDEKLDAIDVKLTKLSVRMARIEKTLNIKKPKRQTQKKPQPEPAQKKPITESSPHM